MAVTLARDHFAARRGAQLGIVSPTARQDGASSSSLAGAKVTVGVSDALGSPHACGVKGSGPLGHGEQAPSDRHVRSDGEESEGNDDDGSGNDGGSQGSGGDDNGMLSDESPPPDFNPGDIVRICASVAELQWRCEAVTGVGWWAGMADSAGKVARVIRKAIVADTPVCHGQVSVALTGKQCWLPAAALRLADIAALDFVASDAAAAGTDGKQQPSPSNLNASAAASDGIGTAPDASAGVGFILFQEEINGPVVVQEVRMRKRSTRRPAPTPFAARALYWRRCRQPSRGTMRRGDALFVRCATQCERSPRLSVRCH